jgi:hypothetical protein
LKKSKNLNDVSYLYPSQYATKKELQEKKSFRASSKKAISTRNSKQIDSEQSRDLTKTPKPEEGQNISPDK